MKEPPAVSPASLLCSQALPSRVVLSSRDVGWKSVLVDLHRVTPTGEVFDTHVTPDQTIVVMTRGEQEIEAFRGGVWRRGHYRAGTVGMTPGDVGDRLRRRVRRGAAPFEKANLYLPQRVLRDAAEHYRRAGHRSLDTPLTALAFNDPLIAQTVAGLLRGVAAGAPDLYAQTAVQWLATHLLSAHSSWRGIAEDRRSPGAISDARLARVLEYMSAHYSEPLALDRLATEGAVSKFHFVRLFRERTGTTPHAFLVELRMEAAQRLLRGSDLGVAEIAARCGFARPAYFATAFTKRYGVSPTAFRAPDGRSQPPAGRPARPPRGAST